MSYKPNPTAHPFRLLVLGFFVLQSFLVKAQCGCDFIISLSASEWQFDGAKKGVKPGNKICFASGTRTGIGIMNVKGTPENPVIITNMCDGKVVIDAPSSYGNCIEVNNCSNIRFTGSANPNEEYGIEIRGGQMGINFQGLSTDFEVDHLKVNFVGCCGIVAKTDPTCDPATWRENFTLRNAKLHDNYIGDTGCEGFYIGNSHMDVGVTKTCNGVSTFIHEHFVDGIEVNNNRLVNIGNDGIQIGGAVNCVVHDNYVYNVATKKNYGHQNGFQAGGGTTGAVVYNNVIDTGTGYCYYDSGGGGIYYNNIGSDCLMGTFLLQDIAPEFAPTGFIVTNNTFVNCKDYGLLMFSENPNPTYFVNNIMVGPNQSNYVYVNLNNPSKNKVIDNNNIKTQDITSVKFVNPSAKDYHLQPGSQAIDKGANMASYGATFDYDRNPRPLGAQFDIGAFEALPNVPTSNAGPDKNVTLPTNTVILNGLGFSASGITGYKWTLKSGGAVTLANETTANLTVSNLLEGIYVFTLEVKDATGSAFDDVTVTVLPAPANKNPVANAGADKSITLPVNTIILNGAGSDPDGTIASYKWTTLSGPSVATLTNDNTKDLTASNLVQGVYDFQLTVTDNNGATGNDAVKVTVNPAAANQLPVVKVGNDITIYLPTTQVSLTGTATDADGTIKTLLWEKQSGPAAALANANTLTLTASNLVLGTYVFRLTATDDKNGASFDEVTVQVLNANQNPVANAGADQVITLPTSTIIINGAGNDTDGTIASYQWTKVSGPATFTLSNQTTANLTASSLVLGVYVFGLTVTDNSGATGYDEVKVTVNAAPPANKNPVANAGADQNITLPKNFITLTGTATDEDGLIQSTVWTKKNGPAATMANENTLLLTLTNLVAGVYTFTLTVTDNSGGSHADNVTVTVLPNTVNQLPVANAGANIFITLPTNSTTLTGIGSDPDGSITTIAWTKISGPNATLTGTDTYTLSLDDLTAGIYNFKLTVTDNNGASASDQVTLTVSASNIPPIIDAGPTRTITLPTNSVQLTATASDPDGTIQNYTWSQLSGPNSATLSGVTSAILTVSNMVSGTYEFRATVSDNNAAIAEDEVIVVVIPSSNNQIPLVSAGGDRVIHLPTNSAVLNGSAIDPDGSIASVEWTVIDGLAPQLVNENTTILTVLNLAQGTYTFRITAIDDEGASAFEDATVIVYAASVNQAPLANGGPNKVLQLPTDAVTLNGSGSDSDGTVVSYKWEKSSGPAANLLTPNAAVLNITNMVEGIYTFTLTVTDDDGMTGTALVTVTVLPASVNKNPLADAGQNQSIILPTNSTTLAGTGYDADGTIQSYSWSKLGGPSGGTIATGNTQVTSITGLTEGTYTYRFTVIDNSGAIGTDDVIITVTANSANRLPIANGGGNQSIYLPTNTLNLFGSGFDADGSITTYAWTKMSGGTVTATNADQPTLTLTNLQEGQYIFKLTVTDNSGATDDDFVTINVNGQAINIPPVAFAGGNKIVKLPQSNTTLAGSGSDTDGQITQFAWTQVGGTPIALGNANTASVNVSSLIEGSFRLRLTVTDNSSATAFDEMTLQVLPSTANLPPVVDAGNGVNVYLPENTATLTGNATDDGTITTYIWSKQSGPQATLAGQTTGTLSLSSLVEGIYFFQLTAVDNNGTSASDTVKVTVFPVGANRLPVVDAGTDQEIVLPNNTTTLDGTATDEDGSITSLQWTKVTGGNATITSDNTLSTDITDLTEGTYVFRLTATDDDGAIASDNVQVIVHPIPPNQAPVVEAGLSQALILPVSEVTLTGTATDVDGTVVDQLWTQVQGPAAATLENAATFTLTAKDLVEGTYIFRLTATDDEGLKGYDNVIIFVSVDPEENEQPPIAYAGDDITITLPDNQVTVNGEGLDPDGFIQNYMWEQIAGSPATFTFDENILHATDLQEGQYAFRLIVTDEDTLTASDDVIISVVSEENEIPNFFSPNNDGSGDFWVFRRIEDYEACRLIVFNRPGKEVFQAKPYQNNWDGTYKGKPLTEGDYYYVLHCDDGRKVTGAVRIIR